jgi:hypothetical protein
LVDPPCISPIFSSALFDATVGAFSNDDVNDSSRDLSSASSGLSSDSSTSVLSDYSSASSDSSSSSSEFSSFQVTLHLALLVTLHPAIPLPVIPLPVIIILFLSSQIKINHLLYNPFYVTYFLLIHQPKSDSNHVHHIFLIRNLKAYANVAIR